MAGNPVDGLAAAQTLLNYDRVTPGYCLMYVWQAYKAHGARATGSYPTAYSAWLASPGKHPGDWNPPPGVPVYFGPRAGSAAGDVVISLGGGRVAATDWPYNGVTNETTIAARQRQIGRPYLGWTDNILGYPILQAQPAPPTPPAPPIPEPVKENDMLQVKLKDNNGRYGPADHWWYLTIGFETPILDGPYPVDGASNFANHISQVIDKGAFNATYAEFEKTFVAGGGVLPIVNPVTKEVAT